MVWMRMRKTKLTFVYEAIHSGYLDWQAEWWWRQMYADAKLFNNGTSEGSDTGENENDTIWVAVETMAWWKVPCCSERVKPPEQAVQGRKEAISRTLTYLCRHGVKKAGYAMDSLGGIRVHDILHWHPQVRRQKITEDDIKGIVAEEHRLAVYVDNEGCLCIKATQGHGEDVGVSIDDGRALYEIQSMDDVVGRGYVCCHGTYRNYWQSIRCEGLKTLGRKHVHFAKQIPSRLQGDKEILILLNVKKWLDDGGKLYLSENDVFLTSGFDGVVPPWYFQQVWQIRPTECILW